MRRKRFDHDDRFDASPSASHWRAANRRLDRSISAAAAPGCPKARRQNKNQAQLRDALTQGAPPWAVNRTAKNRLAEPFAILENAALSVRLNVIYLDDVSGLKFVR